MRNWGLTFALLFVIWSVPAWAQENLLKTDVVVVGATPGGIAAAVSAARLGHAVVLVEWEDHIGGIVTNGLTNSDIDKRQAVGGLFYEFTQRVLQHYQLQDANDPKALNVKLCRNGYWFEASLAERIYNDFLSAEKGRITLMRGHELLAATSENQRLQEITVVDRGTKVRSQLQAKVFVDATYEGDLAALAGAGFRLGRESRDEFGEPHAGFVYCKFRETELLPGSTGAGDEAIEAFCFRLHVTKNLANRVTIQQPAGYRREDYQVLLNDIAAHPEVKLREIIQFFPMPNDRFELNSNHPHEKTGLPSQSFDLAEENWSWPTATPTERQKIYQRYLTHNIGLLWLLQHDAAVPESIRSEALQYGWCQDEWTGNGNVPRQVYVRQGRRIRGTYTLTEKDGDLNPNTRRTPIRKDSIAIAEFAFDSHACHHYIPAHPGVREGYIFIEHQPLQLPYGILVPETLDGLLVPVACSSSHVGYQAIRMEPLFIALGEASGIAAHLAIEKNISLRSVDVAQLQHLLVARRGVITFLEDVPFDHPQFAPLQWLGARGFNDGYRAEPDQQLTCHEAAQRLGRMLAMEGYASWAAGGSALSSEPVRFANIAEWLKQAGFPAPSTDVADPQAKLNTGDLARVIYDSIRTHQNRK